MIDVSVNRRIHLVPRMVAYGAEERRLLPWEPAGLLAEMDAAGVDMAGVIASCVARGVGGEVLATPPEEVSAIVEAHPGRFFGWLGINPLGGMDTLRTIDRGIRELGFKGVHIYPHWFGVPVDDRIYWPIYAKCCELGVPVVLQVGQQSKRGGARLVAEPVRLDHVCFDFPELKVGALHIGVPWAEQSTRLALAHENLFIIADAYSPDTWPPVLVDYIAQRDWANRDGSDKVLWGTDYPVQQFAPSLEAARRLPLPAAALDKLLGGNAARWLGL